MVGTLKSATPIKMHTSQLSHRKTVKESLYWGLPPLQYRVPAVGALSHHSPPLNHQPNIVAGQALQSRLTCLQPQPGSSDRQAARQKVSVSSLPAQGQINHSALPKGSRKAVGSAANPMGSAANLWRPPPHFSCPGPSQVSLCCHISSHTSYKTTLQSSF